MHARLDATKERIKEHPQARSVEEIQFLLQDLERYYAQLDENGLLFSEGVRLIPSNTSGFNCVRDVKKGKFFDC